MTKQEEQQVIQQQLANIKHNKDIFARVDAIYQQSNELNNFNPIDVWAKRVQLGNDVKDIIQQLKFA